MQSVTQKNRKSRKSVAPKGFRGILHPKQRKRSGQKRATMISRKVLPSKSSGTRSKKRKDHAKR